jgi:Skp family chaperone for outer membrane proteins
MFLQTVFAWFKKRREVDTANATRSLTLEEATSDAKLLVAYACSHTPKTDQKLISELVHATAKVSEAVNAKQVPVPPDVEAEFWIKHQNLSKELLPVTATTIKSSSAAWNWGPSITTHAIAAVLLLLLFVITLAAWVTGSTIRADVKLTSKDLQEKRKNYADSRAKLTQIQMQLNDITEELEPQVKVSRTPATQAKVAELQKAILERSNEVRKLSSELGPIQTEMRGINLRRDPLIALLAEWYDAVTFGYWPMKSKQKIEEAIADEEKAKLPAGISRFISSEFLRVNRVQDAKDSYALDLLHRVDLILEVMQRYALPLLLGLLGSLTYILRTQIAQVRAQTFHRPFWSLSIARVGLGLIAGLMGGLVMTTDESVLKALPPLALPFVLGYAIEVLFAFMDKLVNTFIGDGKPAARAA